jgi:hypothetical protein
MGCGMPSVTASTVPTKTAVALLTCRDKGALPPQLQASAGEGCARTQTATKQAAGTLRLIINGDPLLLLNNNGMQ